MDHPLVTQLKTEIGLDETTATAAVSEILGFILEASPEKAAPVVDAVDWPGMKSQDAADRTPNEALCLSDLGERLSGAGVPPQDLLPTAQSFVKFARPRAGDAAVDALIGSINQY